MSIDPSPLIFFPHPPPPLKIFEILISGASEFLRDGIAPSETAGNKMKLAPGSRERPREPWILGEIFSSHLCFFHLGSAFECYKTNSLAFSCCCWWWCWFSTSSRQPWEVFSTITLCIRQSEIIAAYHSCWSCFFPTWSTFHYSINNQWLIS